MPISIASGVGGGPTAAAALDRALSDAGIGDFRLAVVRGIVPAGTEIVLATPLVIESGWGAQLSVVLAHREEVEAGAEAWAGIGWVQEAGTGRGLILGYDGGSRLHVEAQIRQSLAAMAEHRAGLFDPVRLWAEGTVCRDRPVSAVVAAVY